jgi:hypothetical protein
MNEIIYILYLIVFSPFIAIGLYKVFNALIEVVRVRLGQIKVVQKLANDRIVTYWKKPQGDKIKLKDKEVLCRMDKDWAYFTSSLVPVTTVFYDENDRQVMLKSEKGIVPTDEFEKIYNIAYLAGRTSMFQENKMLKMYMMISLIAVIVAAGGIFYLNLKFEDVAKGIEKIISEIALLPKIAAPTNTSIPVLKPG